MRRGRPVEALLALVAAAAALAPLTSLFSGSDFVFPALACMAAVSIAGVLARRSLRSTVGAVLVQTLAGFVAFTALTARGHLWHGLPYADTLLAWNNRLLEAIDTATRYSAPAPTNAGIVTGVVLIAGVLALVVDVVAVTRRAPAAAAIPLLTAYLVSAANATDGLHPVFFVIAAASWLSLLSRQGTSTVRQWGPIAPSSLPERAPSDRWGAEQLGRYGRRLAIVALVLGVLVPVLTPHLPARYLAGGLDRSGRGAGVAVSLSDVVDVARNLRDQSDAQVLRYRIAGGSPQPLRVRVFGRYADGQWSLADGAAEAQGGTGFTAPGAPRRARIEVSENDLSGPQVAAPEQVIGLEPDDELFVDGFGLVRSRDRVEDYALDFDIRAPDDAALDRSPPIQNAPLDPAYLERDPLSGTEVTSVLTTLRNAGAQTPIEMARAIQTYLRSSPFVYSLDLADPVPQPDGGIDPVSQFLLTKQGYCVQYATAMVVLAREAGIPARLVTGFLPGELDGDGNYVVVAADAHAWPELWFEGVGWLRFEPTPGVRSGSSPAWSVPRSQPSASATTSAPSVSSSTGSPTNAPRPTVERPADAGGPVDNASWTSRLLTGIADLSPVWWFVIVLLVGLLGSLALPVLAGSERRRQLARAPDDAARTEVEWQSLVSRLGDLGVHPPRGSTPRQSAEHVGRVVVLAPEERERLHRIVDSVETARYARPGTTVADVSADARAVTSAIGAARPWRARLRAFAAPSLARVRLQAIGTGLRNGIRALTSAARDLAQRRH